MMKTIGIIAPLIDTRQYHANFNLRLHQNNRDLSLSAFYELAGKNFQPELISRGIDHGINIPAAGYYLEGLLRQNGYNTLLTNKYDTETLENLANQDPIAICISTTMVIDTDSLMKLFTLVRTIIPDTCIIAGGSMIWKNYLLYRKHLKAPDDYPIHPQLIFHRNHAGMDADILVVAPHGRTSLLEILALLEKRKNLSFSHIPNLAIPQGSDFLFTKQENEVVDYNEDYTRWDLIDQIPEKIPLRTSIGCPFKCLFCDFYHLYPGIFLRSRESLLKELNAAKKGLGRTPAIIHVTDDNAFVNKNRLHEVCSTITESGFRQWIGFIRAGEYAETEMELIKKSGLMMGLIGVESGDPEQLKRMNKHQRIENVKRGVEQLDAQGISAVMTFIVGFPGENNQTILNTARFLNSLSFTTISASYLIFPLIIHPLSELSDPVYRKKWQLKGNMQQWSHYSMNSEESVQASYHLFRQVTNVPYHYLEESNFFNRVKFKFDTRRELFQLRHQLSIKIIDQATMTEIEPVLLKMAELMGFPEARMNENILKEIQFL